MQPNSLARYTAQLVQHATFASRTVPVPNVRGSGSGSHYMPSQQQYIIYFLPLRLLPSVLLSTPLASSPLVAVPEAFDFFAFLRWCSGIHSSS